MRTKYIMKLSIDSFMQRKLRSWLTILGIVIGVAAVVAILSMAEGMEQSITDQLGGLGGDIITVSPGYSSAFGMMGGGGRFGRGTSSLDVNLTDKDLHAIKTATGVEFVNGIVSGNAAITYLSETSTVSIKGVDPLPWKEITTTELESGRLLTSSDVNAIIIGYGIANDMFKQPIPINTAINIEGKSFRVVGILESSGGFGGDDNTIIMSITAARTIIDDIEQNQFSSIEIKVSDPDNIEEVIGNVEERLMVTRHVNEDTRDFTVSSSQAILDTVSTITSTISLFLGGIAAISLLVGAIGIANTMFMSIMERTRQIGILKALGTTNFEVLKLFLAESAIIGFMGGLVGVLMGIIASGVMSSMGLQMMGPGGSFNAIVTPELVLFALAFSVVIGIVSGLIPARRASKLQPTVALRYE